MKSLPTKQKSKRFFSPAKLNLFFRVLDKRLDGYHEIASLYQAIDLFDEITIALADRELFSSDSNLFWDSSNLIFQAVRLFEQKIEKPLTLSIELNKKIPMQAGLGGGSSNAATTLWAVNELLGFPLKIEELIELAKKIGSDVAFFFSRGAALAKSRGELFQNKKIPSFEAYLAKPTFGMDTKSVYRSLVWDKRTTISPDIIMKSFQKGEPFFCNDLEKGAFLLNPQLKVFKESLYALGFNKVHLTGSGSAYFCIGEPHFFPKEGFLQKVYSISRKESSWYGEC